MASDAYNLRRFIDAQADVYDSVRPELEQEQKRGHWMWFIFPQIAGLGSSSMAQHYALASVSEAQDTTNIRCLARASWNVPGS
jgi:uncharacterized protein (DUF1810 family)